MTWTRLAAAAAIGSAMLGLGACSDDDKRGRRPVSTDGGESATGVDEDDDAEEAGGGLRGLDGGSLGVDRDDAPGADAAVDAGPVCSVIHPQFGCGIASGEWVKFEKGLSVDRRTGFAWYPVVLGKDAEGRDETDDALELKCKALSVPGVSGFRIPEIKDVRTLAAGCAKTLPTGPCAIQSGRYNAQAGGDCACTGIARGPHASGGFCRPEVADCETIWTATFCGSHSQGCVGDADHKHWFFDVKTGAIVVSGYETELAKQAKGRCVSTEQVELP